MTNLNPVDDAIRNSIAHAKIYSAELNGEVVSFLCGSIRAIDAIDKLGLSYERDIRNRRAFKSYTLDYAVAATRRDFNDGKAIAAAKIPEFTENRRATIDKKKS